MGVFGFVSRDVDAERSVRLGGRNGEKCLVRRSGPMVFTANVC